MKTKLPKRTKYVRVNVTEISETEKAIYASFPIPMHVSGDEFEKIRVKQFIPKSVLKKEADGTYLAAWYFASVIAKEKANQSFLLTATLGEYKSIELEEEKSEESAS